MEIVEVLAGWHFASTGNAGQQESGRHARKGSHGAARPRPVPQVSRGGLEGETGGAGRSRPPTPLVLAFLAPEAVELAHVLLHGAPTAEEAVDELEEGEAGQQGVAAGLVLRPDPLHLEY